MELVLNITRKSLSNKATTPHEGMAKVSIINRKTRITLYIVSRNQKYNPQLALLFQSNVHIHYFYQL